MGWVVNIAVLGLALPTALAGPTSYAECQGLYDPYRPRLEQLLAEARRKGDQGSEVTRSQGHFSAKPYFRAAERLRHEHGALLSRISEERSRCTTEVRAFKRIRQRNGAVNSKSSLKA